MSSIEERLVRDIEAMTGGVVTEADLDQAREQVEDRIERSGRRQRRRTAGALLAAAAVAAGVAGVVLVSGPGGETDSAPADAPSGTDPYESFLVGAAPTDETIQGVWRVGNGMSLVRFHQGDVAVDTLGQITTAELTGTYTLEGDRIVMDLNEAAEPGCSGEVVFRASVRGPGEMRMLATGAAPPSCGFEQSGRWVLEHVLPTSRELAGIYPPKRAAYGPVQRDAMPGFWLVAGGGRGLQLTSGNTYFVLGGAGQVIGLGQWWLDGDDLQLESDDGCRLVLGNAQHINPGTDMIRGELAEYGCEWVSLDSGDTMEWFRIPDRSSF